MVLVLFGKTFFFFHSVFMSILFTLFILFHCIDTSIASSRFEVFLRNSIYFFPLSLSLSVNTHSNYIIGNRLLKFIRYRSHFRILCVCTSQSSVRTQICVNNRCYARINRANINMVKVASVKEENNRPHLKMSNKY